MAYISVEEHLPGVTGLLEFRKDTSEPLRELTHILLRGKSTLTEAERELNSYSGFAQERVCLLHDIACSSSRCLFWRQ